MAISTAIDQNAVARVLGIKTTYVDLRGGAPFLPQRVAVFGQGNTASTYALTKRQVLNATEAAQVYGYGSPIHHTVLRLLPTNGDGIGTIPITIYPMEDAGSSVAAVGDITPSGLPTAPGVFRVSMGNILSEKFIILKDDSVAAIVTAMHNAMAATLDLPMTSVDGATKADVTSKWKGASANGIKLAIVGPTDIGVSFAFTQPTGGFLNPTIDAGLAEMGNVWESMVLNCLDSDDDDALDAFNTFGELRWGPITKKPFIVFTGNPASTVSAAIVLPTARRTERVNAQLVSPGSDDLPFVTAARELARIVKQANDNPPVDYGGQEATGLVGGADGAQWNTTEKELAVINGSSTIDVVDGAVQLSDTVTFYHPEGDTLPAYRFVVDIVKVMQAIFRTNLIFATPAWNGAPLIPDDQPTTNPAARKPKDATAQVAGMISGLGTDAIISDPASAKKTIRSGISTTNPKRLDVSYTIQVVGNSNIIAVDLNWGFFFGTAVAA